MAEEETPGKGPGVAVRVQEASPLDSSWQLVNKNEHGRLVEDEAAGGDHTDGRVDLQQMNSSAQAGEEPGAVSASRPQQLFEHGSMVEVKGYGYGVVQWVGKVAGTETAGIELVESLPLSFLSRH